VVEFESGKAKIAQFTAPQVDQPQTIHCILEVTDSGSPPLTAYRRIIVQVSPKSP
jgi:hypothetical protein